MRVWQSHVDLIHYSIETLSYAINCMYVFNAWPHFVWELFGLRHACVTLTALQSKNQQPASLKNQMKCIFFILCHEDRQWNCCSLQTVNLTVVFWSSMSVSSSSMLTRISQLVRHVYQGSCQGTWLLQLRVLPRHLSFAVVGRWCNRSSQGPNLWGPSPVHQVPAVTGPWKTSPPPSSCPRSVGTIGVKTNTESGVW